MRKSVLYTVLAIMLIAVVLWRVLPSTWEWQLVHVEPFRAEVGASLWNWIGVVTVFAIAFAAIYWATKSFRS